MADFAGDWAANPNYQSRIQSLLPQIRQVQQRYGLPDSAIPYILANAGIESRWNVNSPSGSSNDVGLLQVTPILAKNYGAKHTNDLNTQLDLIGQYYNEGLNGGLPLDTLATGWNTGLGRAKQVAAGKRTWDSVTSMAPRYNAAVNNFVNSSATKKFLGGLGINYNSTQRTPAVSRTMQDYNISDAGPRPLTADAQVPSLAPALTGMESANFTADGATPIQQQPVNDLVLDGIIHTDLGLDTRLF